MLKDKTLRYNQDGFASIVIALILIIVLGLITVGFAQLARREQQDALDKQLANQASYAAESGVNDVYNAIYSSAASEQNWIAAATGQPTNPSLGTITPTKCLDYTQIKAINPNSTNLNPNVIDSQTSVSYSCILLNLTPSNLGGTGLPADKTKDLSFQSTTGNLTSLTFSWQSASTNSPGKHTNYSLPTTYPLSNFSAWNPSNSDGTQDSGPVVQLTLTPTNGSLPNPLYRNNLISNTFTAYLYPGPSTDASCPVSNTNSACTVTAANPSSSQAPILDGGCNPYHLPTQNYDCSVTLNLPGNANAYEASITGYYDLTDYSINGIENPGGGAPSAQANFIGEAVIDVTAKAKNVLKRIQVVTQPCATDSSCSASPGALVGAVCKREQTYPVAGGPDVTNFISPTSGGPPSVTSGDCYPYP
jgi:hypothetical protein